jgi:hypothetical protein
MVATTKFSLAAAACTIFSGALCLTAFSPSACPSKSSFSTSTDCAGSIAYANGDKLSGSFKSGKIAGTATYTFASGDRYVGEIEGLILTGKGIYSYAKGGRYVGELVDGKFSGQGTLYYPNGDKYVGQFRDDRLSGSGAIIYADGSRHVGEFKDDHPISKESPIPDVTSAASQPHARPQIAASRKAFERTPSTVDLDSKRSKTSTYERPALLSNGYRPMNYNPMEDPNSSSLARGKLLVNVDDKESVQASKIR